MKQKIYKLVIFQDDTTIDISKDLLKRFLWTQTLIRHSITNTWSAWTTHKACLEKKLRQGLKKMLYGPNLIKKLKKAEKLEIRGWTMFLGNNKKFVFTSDFAMKLSATFLPRE